MISYTLNWNGQGSCQPSWIFSPSAVDLERDTESPLRVGRVLEGAPSILHVASLVPVKGQEILLRAFAKLKCKYPGAVLHLVGEGPLWESLSTREPWP